MASVDPDELPARVVKTPVENGWMKIVENPERWTPIWTPAQNKDCIDCSKYLIYNGAPTATRTRS